MPGTSTDRSDFDRALAELQAQAASLLRAHDRLGHRRRRCGSGHAPEGDRGVAAVGSIENPEGWLFRIAHHAALDFCAAGPAKRRGRAKRIRTWSRKRRTAVAIIRSRRRAYGPSCACRPPSAASSFSPTCSAIRRGSQRRHGQQHRSGEVSVAARPHAAARTGTGARRPSTARLVGPERARLTPMSSASMRATSTPYAACSPTT